MKANLAIRKKAKERGIYLWQVADRLGIHDTEFSKMMRYELSGEEKAKIAAIIEELADSDKK